LTITLSKSVGSTEDGASVLPAAELSLSLATVKSDEFSAVKLPSTFDDTSATAARVVTATGSVFNVLTRFLVRSAAGVSTSVLSELPSSMDCFAITVIRSINSCLRNLSASVMPSTFAISRNSDTSLVFSALISINFLLRDIGFYFVEFIQLHFSTNAILFLDVLTI